METWQVISLLLTGFFGGWWACYKAIQHQLTREAYYNEFIARGNKRFKHKNKTPSK